VAFARYVSRSSDAYRSRALLKRREHSNSSDDSLQGRDFTCEKYQLDSVIGQCRQKIGYGSLKYSSNIPFPKERTVISLSHMV
jgi:hypothetical protein